MRQMPGASTQLLLLQAAQQGLAIYEEGFLPSSNSSSSSLFDEDLRAAAQQLLRQLRFLQPNPGRLLVSISSRGWQKLLLQQQQQEQQPVQESSSSSSSAAAAEFLLPGFELSLQQAAAEGLIRPVAAVSIPIPSDLTPSSTQASTAAAVDTEGFDPWLALCSQSSSSGSGIVAAAYRAFSNGGKALACTSSATHARQLSVTLNLQGISSLTLHDDQPPEDQAAVLDAFREGPDRVLVSSSAGDAAAAAVLGGDISCLLMVAAEADEAAYAAWLAPVLLPAVAGSSSSSSQCVVVDFVGANVTAAAAAGSSGVGAAIGKSLTCSDVLGSYCVQLPLPAELAALAGGSNAAAAAAAAAAKDSSTAAAAITSSRRRRRRSSSSSSSTASLTPATSSSSIAAIRGDLIWTILDSGSWAIPLKRGRGANMTGSLVLWLTKKASGWVPEVEEGLGQLTPLPGTSGKPLRSLQRARVSGFVIERYCAILYLYKYISSCALLCTVSADC
jgi:hypothetical protein